MTRAIGRCESEASPISTLSNACAQSKPVKRRMPVPAFPQSKGAALACRPCKPTPWMIRDWASGVSMRTPNWLNILAVARVSSPSRKPLTCVGPSAKAPKMMARCEMDLSPGTRNRPCRPDERAAVQVKLMTERPAGWRADVGFRDALQPLSAGSLPDHNRPLAAR